LSIRDCSIGHGSACLRTLGRGPLAIIMGRGGVRMKGTAAGVGISLKPESVLNGQSRAGVLCACRSA
jgi:hypothetical protein